MAVGLAGLRAGAITEHDRISCPGYIDLGDTRSPLLEETRPRFARPARRASRTPATSISTKSPVAPGMDAIAAVAEEFSLGADTGVDLPGARKGLMPTKAWRQRHGHAWNVGDTIVSGIGQGYIQVTPLQLATYVSRIATGRAVVPATSPARSLPSSRPAQPLKTGRRSTFPRRHCRRSAPACSPW